MAKRKKSRRKVDTFKIIYWIIVVALVVTIGFVIKNIISLHMEKNRLEQQEQELLNTREELNAELKNVDDLEYIEEQARKLLKMIKPGEVLYVVDGDNPTPGTDTEQESEEVVIPEPVTQEEATETEEWSEETTWEEPEATEEWSEESTWEEPAPTEEWTDESTPTEETGGESEETWDVSTEDTGIVSEEEVTEYVEEDVEE